jgi:hypothetical protein
MVKNVLIEVLKNGDKKSKNSRLRMKIITEFKKRNSEKEKNKKIRKKGKK